MSTLAEILPWDSAFFGVKIARLYGRTLSAADATELARWAAAEGVRCVYALIDAADFVAPRTMAALGAPLVDVRVTLSRDAGDVGPTPSPTASPNGVREAVAADVPALEAIAATAHLDSRYYADMGFSRDRCDELYRTWIRKAVHGADGVVTFDHDGSAAGYVTYATGVRGAAADVGEIGLVAVAERARGQGAASALVDAALVGVAARGARTVRVVTQGRNVAAQRMYQRRGFRTESVELWYHIWFTNRTSES